VGATLDETRLELEAQRARVRTTAERLESATRGSLDVRAIIGRNPGRTIGLAAGAAFVLLGGPRRTVRAVRRAITGPADAQKAYAALPPPLRKFVDDSASGFGSARDESRGELALALHAWRENPKNRKKAQKLVNETLTPPGPSRAFWSLVEVAAVTAAGIIARQVVARQLAGGVGGGLFGRRPGAGSAPPAPMAEAVEADQRAKAGTGAPAAGRPKAARGAPSATAPKASSGAPSGGYTGWSGRPASVAGPAQEPKAATETKP
jgi:hypothetical protein